MIEHVRLCHFKCFEDEHVRLGGLTLLAGMNGTGKSSVIQALLLLRQSGVIGDGTLLAHSRWALRWQGSLIDVGSFRDVLHEGAGQRDWRRGTAEAPVLPKVHAESEPTMQQFGHLRRFPGANGRIEVFAPHAMVGSRHRIHFRLMEQERSLEIGYVGVHLPTKKFH